MQYNRINLDKIAKFFEKKIKEEGREAYNSFIKENHILEFSDIIECINYKNENNLLVKRNPIYEYEYNNNNYYYYNYIPNSLTSTSNCSVTISNCSVATSNCSVATSNCSVATSSFNNNLGNITLANPISTSDINFDIDSNLYLLIPKDFAQKIFLLESL